MYVYLKKKIEKGKIKSNQKYKERYLESFFGEEIS